jgi:hypothetical protein
MRWIEHIREPERLVLAWQAPDEIKNRTRFAVGELLRRGDDADLRYHSGTPDVLRAAELGYHGYPAFKLNVESHHQGVMAAFMRRLPPRGRGDFGTYLSSLRFLPSKEISDFALLAATEAKLPSDGFSLVDTFDDLETPAEVMLEVSGYRHCQPDLTQADIGASVSFVPEPDNQFDANALMIVKGDKKLGYVNKLQAPQLLKRLNQLSGNVERLNGTPDKPRAFVFVEFKTSAT